MYFFEEDDDIQRNDEDIKKEEHSDIEVVTGDGNLDISPVTDYIEVEKPKPKENRNIIIPEVKDNITNSDSKS